MAEFGSGELSFEVVEGWGELPEAWAFGQVIGVAVDSRDNVYVFNRSEHPVIVFEREGGFLNSWGEGVFGTPHGIYIDDSDNVYCTDSGDHTVRKFTTCGLLLQTLGTKGVPGDDGAPFNRPTDAAISPSGQLFVSDGYGNSSVHRFSPEGELLNSWGEKGDAPGQFDVPHDVWVLGDGRVFVADRQNDRIQIFTQQGEYLGQWTGLDRPCSMFIDPEENVFVAELRSRMSILDMEGEVLARWGGERSSEPGLFVAPHCVWVDSHGDLYVGETLEGKRIQKFIRKN